jgi:hypothetical protein
LKNTVATQYQTVNGHHLTALQKAYSQQSKRDRRAAALDRIAFNKEVTKVED